MQLSSYIFKETITLFIIWMYVACMYFVATWWMKMYTVSRKKDTKMFSVIISYKTPAILVKFSTPFPAYIC